MGVGGGGGVESGMSIIIVHYHCICESLAFSSLGILRLILLSGVNLWLLHAPVC